MTAATHICTHCGYEGKPQRPPSDEAGSDGETRKALRRVSGLLFPGLGMLIEPLAMVLVLPIYIILWPIRRKLNPAKHCPNCGLPLMVNLKSDAGWLAKRKADIKAGLVQVDMEEKPKIVFGKEIILPGDEKVESLPVAEALQSLPALHVLLQEEEKVVVAEPVPDKAVSEAPPPKKKPVDPEQW
jgi:hypothetical protein